MTWKLEHKQGDVIRGAQNDYGTHSDTEWTRWGYQGGPGSVVANAHYVKVGEKINGSGPQSFGGVKTWPYVELQVEFPAERVALAHLFAEELRAFTDQFLKLNNLDARNPDDKG